MNKKEIIYVTTSAIAFLMLLFPPWLASGNTAGRSHIGHHFLFAAISDADHEMFVSMWLPFVRYSPSHVDAPLLAVQLVVLLIVAYAALRVWGSRP